MPTATCSPPDRAACWCSPPDGKHLGTIQTGQATSNCAFGGADGRTLYMTADDYLMRVQLKTKGLGF